MYLSLLEQKSIQVLYVIQNCDKSELKLKIFTCMSTHSISSKCEIDCCKYVLTLALRKWKFQYNCIHIQPNHIKTST